MQGEQRTDVAVVGAGVMGAGIAQIAAQAGHRVVVVDQNDGALEQGRRTIDASLSAMVRKGRLGEGDREAVLDRVQWSTDITDAASCGLAVEAIVERLDAKRSLFAALAGVLSADAVLASNTSSLPIAAIAEGVDYPERVVGLHFFNPVPLMKLVEIIAAPSSDPAVIAAMAMLMRTWGKHPVVARDVPGFIVNRVARPYYAEAFVALAEHIPAAAIDRALVGPGGFRMGPLALADMIGHDTNFAVANIVHDAGFGVARFRPQPAQGLLVAHGRLGRKTGQGVYNYDGEMPVPALEPAAPGPLHIAMGQGEVALAALCADATDAIDPDGQDHIALIDSVRVAMSDGRPLSARVDADVLIDAVRDVGKADLIAFTAINDRAAMVVAGLIQAGGRQALRLPDRPGLIVLRTLAQIANAAADAVADGVTDALGVDEAMLFGANHPEGPLAWAARFGTARLTQVLAHIAAATDDFIYCPSAGLRIDETISL